MSGGGWQVAVAGNVQVCGALLQEGRWGAGASQREDYNNEWLPMGGEVRLRRELEQSRKSGLKRWDGRARFKVRMVATEPRSGAAPDQGWDTTTS